MAAQLKHQFDDEKVVSISKQEPKFQAYKAVETQTLRYKDLVFFSRIVAFAIFSVLSCYVLLSAHLTPLLAFPLGMIMGVLITLTFNFLLDLLRS